MRYSELVRLCRELQPETIMEIGVWEGVNSCEMVQATDRLTTYYGFDMFGSMTDEICKRESGPIEPWTRKMVRIRLSVATNANIVLVEGDTRVTLQPSSNSILAWHSTLYSLTGAIHQRPWHLIGRVSRSWLGRIA